MKMLTPNSSSGTFEEKGAPGCCLEPDVIFAILEPSGKDLPLPECRPGTLRSSRDGDDDIEGLGFLGVTDADSLPVLVSP